MTTQYFHRGLLLYQQGRYREAIAELRMQLTQDSEDSFTHGLIALALTELEQFNDATEHAQRAIHLAPDEAYGHYVLARVMIGRQRYDEAQSAILEAIRLEPYDADYFGLLANLELLKRRWREALEAADRGLAIDPEHNLCTNMRAQALIKLGDRASAAATMGEALTRRPDDALTHANQGWAMLHAGDPHKALEHFRESLRLDPAMEWSRQGTVEALKAAKFPLSLDARLVPVDVAALIPNPLVALRRRARRSATGCQLGRQQSDTCALSERAALCLLRICLADLAVVAFL
jgi:tetratricopeptide (TPR) repeat protein